ncbi:MAG: ABC transporter permease [Proteobacteria bacterium]|nr:ABC transporter permease [Pseudomonadota bacterium]NIS70631.1 ABC transporter permease [Pseudomonadota bacterium]
MGFSGNLDELKKTIIAGVIGFAVGALIMMVYGYDPISAYRALFNGAFGDLYGFSESLANATPLILTALTFAIGFRGGMFNIGAEGQLYLGACAGVTVSLFHLPFATGFALGLILAALAGAIWSLPVAILKATRGVHEVISTIMLNWISLFLAFYLVAEILVDPLRAEKTISIAEGARFPVMVPGTSLSYAIFISLGAAIIVYILLWRTVIGFDIRAMGYNPLATTYAGIERWKVILFVFITGGLTAGLAGAVHVMGRPPTYAIYSGMPSIRGLGFEGLAVAMIGRNHPIGIIISAIFFGGLMAGGRMMQLFAQVPLEMVRVVEGAVVLFLAIPELIRLFSFLRTMGTLHIFRSKRS